MITVWKTPLITTVEQVIRDLRIQSYGTGLFRDMRESGTDMMVTCPFHGGGKERNPSCGILLQEKTVNGKTYEAGTTHCYTCGYTADLPQLVADIQGLGTKFDGFKWLVKQYNYDTDERETPELNLYRGSDEASTHIDEADVKAYTKALLQSYEACEYLKKRGLPNWIPVAFDLGYDAEDKTILFPVRDMSGKAVFYKGRSIAGKRFYNAKDVDKSSLVYGLYELCNGNFSGIDGKATADSEVWITESEIDALSLIGKGVYAVAIMGSHISEKQARLLEKAPFRRYVLALDNDEAGRKGAVKIKDLLIPKGFRFVNLTWHTGLKDINDLITTYGGSWQDYLTGH